MVADKHMKLNLSTKTWSWVDSSIAHIDLSNVVQGSGWKQTPVIWSFDPKMTNEQKFLIEGSPNKIPKEWRELLNVVRSVAPDAVIAGGCLRDLDMGVAPKDIDIWVYAESFPQVKGLHKRLKTVGFVLKPMKDESDEQDYPEEFGSELVSIIRGKHHLAGGIPVEIIATTMNTGRIVDRFDYAVCQIMYDGEYLWRSNEYQDDRKNKTFTLRLKRNQAQFQRSVERYCRFKERYPKWSFRIADSVFGGVGDDSFSI